MRREHLDLVAEQQYAELRRRQRVSEEELDDALWPWSGAATPSRAVGTAQASTEYVVPDVFVRKVDNRWQVEISSTGVPRLSVNQKYAELLRGNTDHAALRSQLQEARWLVRSLEIRNETLLKFASCIVSRQQEFLEHGEEAMKPLVSTRRGGNHRHARIDRFARYNQHKYMHTPRGVFEFKYFFSSHLSTVDGKDQSSTSVRAKIRKLIGAENPT